MEIRFDSFTAVSLVSSIVQFVDFASKLLVIRHDIRTSGGVTSQIDLSNIAHELQARVSDLTSKTAKDRHDDLSELTTSCLNIAQEFHCCLEKLRSDPQMRRWGHFKQVLRISRTEEQVDSITDGLERVRDEVQFRVIVALRKTLDSVKSLQDRQLRALDSQANEVADGTDGHGQLAQERHDELVHGLNVLSHALGTIRVLPQIYKNIEPEAHKWIGVAKLDGWEQFERKFLNFLGFRQILHRQDEVEAEHKYTFQWIFDNPQEKGTEQSWDNFGDWLQRGNGCYWINGKPGSGKSTLMKYISMESATASYLAAWAGPRRLCIASCHFWKSGTTTQKSQAGLFRSLLYSILSKHRDLIPICFPHLFTLMLANKLDISQSPSFEELRKAFTLLDQQEASRLRICLFVDGVDEFDGDHMELANHLKTMSDSGMVKIVVSSRSTPDCIHAFKNSPKLQLQDLTRPDIRAYVYGLIEEHKKVQPMSAELQAQVPALVDEIVMKASGAFLWVMLVTKSLLTGLGNSDNLADLKNRLAEFPLELHDLYKHMLASMDQRCRTQASHLLQIVFQAMNYQRDHPLTALQLSFASEDPLLALRLPIQRITFEEKYGRCKSMEGRLRSRLCGLVELHKSHGAPQLSLQHSNLSESPEPISILRTESSFWQNPEDLVGSTVGFLHQSVVDFLCEPDVWSYILSLSDDPHFDANTALLASCLSLTKCMGEKIARRNVLDCLTYAELAEETIRKPHVEFLDDLDRTMSYYWQEPWTQKNLLVPPHHQRHWAVSITYAGGYLERHSTFFSLAAHKGLVLYTAEYLRHKSSKIIGRWDRPLLVQLLRDFEQASETLQGKYVRILEMLLQHGASPNREHNGDPCAWFEALQYVNSKYQDLGFLAQGELQKSKVELWSKIMEAFINYGAEPNALFQLPYLRTPLEVIRARPRTQSTELKSGQSTEQIDDDINEIKVMESRWQTLLLQCGARDEKSPEYKVSPENDDKDDRKLASGQKEIVPVICIPFHCFRRSRTPKNS